MQLTDYALEIASRQYFKKDENGKPIEDFDGMLTRVARHIARAEAIELYKIKNGQYPDWYLNFDEKRKYLTDPAKLDVWISLQGPEYVNKCNEWELEFYSLMNNKYFMPGGRILAGCESNHGNLLNCYVVAPNGREIVGATNDVDSIDGIWELSYKLAKITKTGGGNGIWLGFLREKGSYVYGSEGTSSGPVSFLRHVFAPTLDVVRQGGTRRGAGMATLNIDHPDILDFLTAKDLDREAVEGKIGSFNISILVSDAFMEAVENDDYWTFTSVKNGKNINPSPVTGKYHLPGQSPSSVSGNPSDVPTSKLIPLLGRLYDGTNSHTDWKPVVDSFPLQENGIMAIEYAIPARWLWNEIAEHAWATGDPGVIFIDRINEFNPLRYTLGEIKATNPCGEQPLYPGESCDLGAMILPTFVQQYFDEEKFGFMEDAFEEEVGTAVRFLDNVLTMSVHAIRDTDFMCSQLRRIGLGLMGEADALIKMGVGYSDDWQIREDIASYLREYALRASQKLAKERGPFPMWAESTLPVMRRNVFVTTIAPTGTTSMIMDVSSGLEPIFALVMMRKVGNTYYWRLHPPFENWLKDTYQDLEDYDKTTISVHAGIDSKGQPFFKDQEVPVILADIIRNNGSIKGLDNWFTKEEQRLWQTAHDVPVDVHVRVQGIWQQTLDGSDEEMPHSSISKTTNLPHSATVEDVLSVYDLGFKQRLKGITMYRDGSRSDQVLRTDVEKETTVTDEECIKCEELEAEVSALEDEIQELTERFNTPTERGLTTNGEMYKAEFVNGEGKRRKVYCYVGFNDNNEIVEIFLIDRKGGKEIFAYADALGILASTALKNGVPVRDISKALRGIQGDSVSYNGGMYQSVPDFIAKLLDGSAVPTPEFNEDSGVLDGEVTQVLSVNQVTTLDGKTTCPECGEREVVLLGGCPTCLSCGNGKCE